MYTEKNTIALRQLFEGENIYLLKEEFIKLPVETQATANNSPTISTELPKTVVPETIIQYYEPKQKVVVILSSLNPMDSELLGKILGAVKLDLQSVDIIELDKNSSINLSQIFTQKFVNQVITFGVDLSKVGIDIKLMPYQILENQGIKFIYSDSLTAIQNDIPKKKALWGSLKEMFM